ncbi:MAG: 4-hydroxy-tetrahydrodipicolinate synthase [Gemmatimonadetes bacterium 21-71-4]|nr:MAG: 4-hydroxy-tetrahydrodipicolinate synthase [Gemmatimonadetes bacterium 21-71-4]
MTVAEHRRVVEIVVQETNGRVPVVAGAASNDTVKAIALSREMEAVGATHLLHASPMYNKPPQRGIIAHFEAIARETTLPIVVYNVPGRTGSNIEARTTLTLSRVPHIAAVKEASGNLAQVTDILAGRAQSFSVLSGDDELTLAMMAAGADGIISVISNATPRLMSQLCERALAGDFTAARELHFTLLPWMRAAFIESNPLAAKAALAMMGRIQNVLRLPLVPLDPRHDAAVRAALQHAGALA